MVRAFGSWVFAALTSWAAIAASPAFSDASPEDSVRGLAGRWAGQGTLTLASGPAEAFQCVMTYFPSADGSQMKQNLRCKGSQSKLEAATHLSIKGGNVTGKWEDKVYSLNGTVSGTMKEGGYDLVLDSQFFRAKMVVVGSSCEQSVKLVPGDTSEMKEMAAVLKRC